MTVSFKHVAGFTALAVAISGIFQHSALAYNVSLKGRVHERITRLAEICNAMRPLPRRCPLPADKKAFDEVDWKASQYWHAVRWPDDPTDQAKSAGAIKFGLNAGLGNCRRYVEKADFAGIMCSGHYGSFQFIHAMASTADETTDTTRNLILGWAKFTFRVATGRIGTQDDYCATVRAQDPSLAKALAPVDFPFCSSPGSPGWQVRSLFAFRCHGLFGSGKCDPDLDHADALARENAIGALLHLIQDSYSQSHTGRSELKPTGPYQARIDCLPVQQFYDYNMNHKAHSKADKLPEIAETCRTDGAIIDPVTATARMLRYLAQGADGEAAAMTMLDKEVLG